MYVEEGVKGSKGPYVWKGKRVKGSKGPYLCRGRGDEGK